MATIIAGDDTGEERLGGTHTPGPWHTDRDYVRDRAGLRVADCYSGWKPDGRVEADARLIAAAPDLLAALKWAEAALAPFSKDPAEKSGIALIRAALSKAESQT